MKFLTLCSLLTLAVASPLLERQVVDTRQELDYGDNSSCPKAIFIWGRGSTESGNMGVTYGPIIADKLEEKYGTDNIWVQGIDGPWGPYVADNYSNILPGGTSLPAMLEGVRLFNEAYIKCPNSTVIAAGYSQGSAVIAGAISFLTAPVRDQIKGVVVFGYTQNKQNKGTIPTYPQDRLVVYCAEGDAVCEGILIVTPAHSSYTDEATDKVPPFFEGFIGD